MSCSQCVGIEIEFDHKLANKELLEYHDNGPAKETELLIEALKAEGVSGKTHLDIGGGVGVIQHELVKIGVSSCISVEASKAYVKTATEEAERQGHAERITHLHGNFVDLAADISPCDIVTLDRVICCYHDVQSLVQRSSALAKSVYGLVYPRDRVRTKIAGVLENAYHWLRRRPFRFFVHPPEVVEEILRKEGFEQSFYQEVGMWQIEVYRRRS